MLKRWTERELRSRYRQSLLGIGWALFQPVFQMLVISLIFGSIMKIPSDGFPYPVFLYAALLPWTLFANSVTSAVPSITTNMQLVSKIYFPREILPLSAILARIADFLVASSVFILMMIWYDVPVHFGMIYLPLLLAIQIMLALAVSLVGASVSVFVRDISFAVPLLMQLWMYASPVIYPISAVPERWRTLYVCNPMAGIIDSYRRVLLHQEPPNMEYLGIAAALSFAACLLAYVYFKRLEPAMADVL